MKRLTARLGGGQIAKTIECSEDEVEKFLKVLFDMGYDHIRVETVIKT